MFTQSAIRHNHIAYFKHVFDLFSSLKGPIFTPKIKTFTSKKVLGQENAKTYSSSSFATLTLPIFDKYKTLFYENNKKKVPSTIMDLLTYRGLSYWIMDDGSLQNKGLHLNTYAFSDADILLLINVLKVKFNLTVSLHKHKKGNRIYIWENSLKALRPHIEMYIIDEMAYKIGL